MCLSGMQRIRWGLGNLQFHIWVLGLNYILEGGEYSMEQWNRFKHNNKKNIFCIKYKTIYQMESTLSKDEQKFLKAARLHEI